VPNDTYYTTKQWNYEAISLPEAWEITKGSKDITVAVIDTGVDLDHPDLKEQLVAGIDLVSDDEDYFPGPEDRNRHGTHVAGIIGADSNNNLGIAGVNWKVNIMPIRALDSSGNGSNSTISSAIIWAVNHGADVINISVGSFKESKLLEDAVDYAYRNKVTIVAASGNYGKDELLYPAEYDKTIAVGAVDTELEWVSYSHYGEKLDFVAPGQTIYSTITRASYAIDSGTSMATPHVAGLVALILASEEVTTPTQIKEQLRLTAQDLGAKGWDKKYGYGLINAHAAVTNASILKTKIFAGKEEGNIIKLKSQMVSP
jgi:serine protease